MNAKNSKFYHLLIIPKLISKSKRFYKIFKPKEIIESESYELSFIVFNIGNNYFPGGTTKKIIITYTTAKGGEDHNPITISKIPGKKAKIAQKIETKCLKGIAISSGTAWIKLEIKSKDGKQVKHYLLDRIIGEKKEIPTEKPFWENCFHVTSQQEIHQRYTNYLLLILTTLTILLFIINILLFLR